MTKLSRTNKRSVKKSTPVSITAEAVVPESEMISKVTEDWSILSYRDLQLNAKIHGLKASGTKADLIARLQEGG